MMQRFLTIILGLALFTLPTAGRLDDSSDGPQQPLPGFVPSDTLARLLALPEDELQAEIAASSALDHSVEDSLQAIRYMLISREKGKAGLIKDSRLTAAGCRFTWPSHRELMFLDEESLTTPHQRLFQRAHHVFVAEVLQTEAGFMGSVGMTLITVRVLDEIAPRKDNSDLPEILIYSDNRYEISLGDDFLCSERPGFHMPTRGDQLLVVADRYRSDSTSGGLAIRATNVFPIAGGVIQPQPYNFLQDETGLTIEEARALRARVE